MIKMIDANGETVLECLERLYTKQTVLERLERLYTKLWNEGWYTDANTVALALQQIEKDNDIELNA